MTDEVLPHPEKGKQQHNIKLQFQVSFKKKASSVHDKKQTQTSLSDVAMRWQLLYVEPNMLSWLSLVVVEEEAAQTQTKN